ncbi:2897_t:CDS:2 [Ambispora leptoticha]|uniref:2897_t:CDS:1 n=1 Tax=Ambispora leptoticha TaxID=144679 RepID=A0A9N8ZJX3_9GLOM|nr:2897_t:CDS:2 [Ambispora leptoticha]
MVKDTQILVSRYQQYQPHPPQQNPVPCSGAGYALQHEAFWRSIAASSSVALDNPKDVLPSPVSSSSDEEETIARTHIYSSMERMRSDASSEWSNNSSPLQSSSSATSYSSSTSENYVSHDAGYVQKKRIRLEEEQFRPKSRGELAVTSSEKIKAYLLIRTMTPETMQVQNNVNVAKNGRFISMLILGERDLVIRSYEYPVFRQKKGFNGLSIWVKILILAASSTARVLVYYFRFHLEMILNSTPEWTLPEFSKLQIAQQNSYPAASLSNSNLKLVSPPPSVRSQLKNQHKRSRSLSEEEDEEVRAFMSAHERHCKHDLKRQVIATASLTQQFQPRTQIAPTIPLKSSSNGNLNALLEPPTNGNDNGNNNGNAKETDFAILDIIPSLISEKSRKAAFVDNLVDTAALIIEVIWSHFHINPVAKIIPLKIFIQETLRRSRTSYSTLQTALFYLFRIKSHITSRAFQLPSNGSRDQNKSCPMTPTPNSPACKRDNSDPATCGRRMFLAALIIASKYLQDRNYSNKAWSKISGLPVKEINQNEIVFLKLIDYNLFISEGIFKRWSSLLLTHIQAISGFSVKNADAFRQMENQREVERFREKLQNLNPKTMECQRNCLTGSLMTPDPSTPSTPRGTESEFTFITSSVSSCKEMRNVQKLSGILNPQEMMHTDEVNGSSVSRCSSSTVSPIIIYARPESQ